MYNGILKREDSTVATLTLKNVPESLIERLKEEAKESRRSLNQETLNRLEQSLALRWQTAQEKVNAIQRNHARFADLEPLTDLFIDRAKKAGRP